MDELPVVIIGAGPQGLAAAAHATERFAEHLHQIREGEPVGLESRGSVRGHEATISDRHPPGFLSL